MCGWPTKKDKEGKTANTGYIFTPFTLARLRYFETIVKALHEAGIEPNFELKEALQQAQSRELERRWAELERRPS